MRVHDFRHCSKNSLEAFGAQNDGYIKQIYWLFQIFPILHLTLFSTGRGVFAPPGGFFKFSIGKRHQKGMKVVCKLKFGKLLDNKKDFRSKNFFGAEPRALKVEWVANFGISKS